MVRPICLDCGSIVSLSRSLAALHSGYVIGRRVTHVHPCPPYLTWLAPPVVVPLLEDPSYVNKCSYFSRLFYSKIRERLSFRLVGVTLVPSLASCLVAFAISCTVHCSSCRPSISESYIVIVLPAGNCLISGVSVSELSEPNIKRSAAAGVATADQ